MRLRSAPSLRPDLDACVRDAPAGMMAVPLAVRSRSGQPCIRGMRIMVGDVLAYLAGGISEDEILADFPYLTGKDSRACLAYSG